MAVHGLLLGAWLGSVLTAAAAAESPPNRLAGEHSPYLLQHAHDLVDWHPWGAEAFALARTSQRPIFLSIGFSTCHWCHVMERESFKDPVTAAFLNEHFICIKVDRDERPDVDQIYMTFVQATTGSGGWPLSVWLTPDREPFAGGTYFAPQDRPGRPGFRTVLDQVAAAWQADREQLLTASRVTTAALVSLAKPPPPSAETSDADLWNRAFTAVAAEFDRQHGGFGGPPRFPRPATLAFLFRLHEAAPASGPGREALAMALATLRGMTAGGIRDQLGGGFHRYAVDAAWRRPHFERLLPDQAQLAIALLTASRLTGEEAYALTARTLLDSVLADMADGGGGFHAAIDAESPATGKAANNGEGAFYRWTQPEIAAVVGSERAAVFCHHYGPESADPAPGSVLWQRHALAETAAAFGLSSDQAEATLAECRRLLLAARRLRPSPPVDDTLITGWNGLMISALARGHQVLGDHAYLAAANAAADRLLRDHVFEDGSLCHARRGDGDPKGGFADDHAFLVQGLLDLYESSFDPDRLSQAIALQDRQDLEFWDAEEGGYFATASDDPFLLVRLKPDRDEALPSANAVAVANLVRLATILDQPDRMARAAEIVAAFRGRLEQTPTAALQMLAESGRLAGPPTHVVITGFRDAADTAALLRSVWRTPGTNRIVLLADGDEQLAALSPLVRPILAVAGSGEPRPATAYVCSGEICLPPTTSPETLAKLLGELPPAGR